MVIVWECAGIYTLLLMVLIIKIYQYIVCMALGELLEKYTRHKQQFGV